MCCGCGMADDWKVHSWCVEPRHHRTCASLKWRAATPAQAKRLAQDLRWRLLLRLQHRKVAAAVSGRVERKHLVEKTEEEAQEQLEKA